MWHFHAYHYYVELHVPDLAITDLDAQESELEGQGYFEITLTCQLIYNLEGLLPAEPQACRPWVFNGYLVCSCQIYLQPTNGYVKYHAAAPGLTAGEHSVAAFVLDSCVVESMKLTKPRGIWCALPWTAFSEGECVEASSTQQPPLFLRGTRTRIRIRISPRLSRRYTGESRVQLQSLPSTELHGALLCHSVQIGASPY